VGEAEEARRRHEAAAAFCELWPEIPFGLGIDVEFGGPPDWGCWVEEAISHGRAAPPSAAADAPGPAGRGGPPVVTDRLRLCLQPGWPHVLPRAPLAARDQLVLGVSSGPHALAGADGWWRVVTLDLYWLAAAFRTGRPTAGRIPTHSLHMAEVAGARALGHTPSLAAEAARGVWERALLAGEGDQR
jgi:hypothetical protein